MNKKIEILKMPKWGMTMVEGNVVAWLKEEGDSFEKGEEILEIETDKITNVIEAENTTQLQKILVPAGKTAKCGEPLAILSNEALSDVEISSMIETNNFSDDSDEKLPEERFVLVEDLKIRVVTRLSKTNGLPVILIHGFGADASSWQLVESHLLENYSLHTIELPSHGGSSIALNHTSVTDLTKVVSQAVSNLAPNGCHLIGHSLGGLLAITVAKKLSPMIKSATLIAPAGLGQEISRDFLQRFITVKKRREMKEVLALLVENSNLITSHMIEKALMAGRIDGATEALTKISEDMIKQSQNGSVKKIFEKLNCSLKVIWGSKDLVVPVAESNCEIIEGVGHMPHIEAPAKVNKIIEEHIKENY